MKKKIIAFLFCIVMVCFKLSSETPKILLGADCLYGFIPSPTIGMEIPSNSAAKGYFGLKVLPAIAFNYIEAYGRAGYAFKKPDNWEKYHIEILGNIEVGAQIGLITTFSVIPMCELGVQVAMMPEDHGFYFGVSPNVMMLFVPQGSDIRVQSAPSIYLSAGWKF